MKKPKDERYVVHIELGLRFEDEVRGGAAGVEGLRGLLVTDASGKGIETSDPLLAKLFVNHFEKAKAAVSRVLVTEVGAALIFEVVALDDKPFRELFGDIAERYGKNLWDVVDKAKDMWLETMRKLYKDIKRVADEAAKVGKRDVEAGRRALVEGLRRLFEEKERKALSAGRLDDALAIAVTGRLTVGIVNSPWEWLSLLAGGGVVDVANKTLGFSAKYGEVAEAVLRLLAVWAGVYGAEIRRGKQIAMLASPDDTTEVLRALLKGDVLKYAESLAKSWNGFAGLEAPKLISLLALAQLLGVVEGKWAVEFWLAHKAVVTLVEPEVAQVLDRLFARVEEVGEVKWEEEGVSLSFKVRDVRSAEQVVTLRLHTDFAHFYLYCDSCSEASARRALETVAEQLRPAVEQLEGRLRLAAKKWPKWEGNALVLPAKMGWPMFLKLWRGYNAPS